MLEWLRSKQHAEPCPWGPKLCSSAIKHGHLDLLQWSRAQQDPVRWDWHACNAAAELGERLALLSIPITYSPHLHHSQQTDAGASCEESDVDVHTLLSCTRWSGLSGLRWFSNP